MITKVYLAGASKELDRAKQWAAKLREADIMVTSTWVEVIGKVGAANPADASLEQLTKWTLRDLAEVDEADILMLLLPAKGVETVGGYIELGYAYAKGKIILSSGLQRPIFTLPLSTIAFEDDAEAFKRIVEHHRERVGRIVDKHKEALRISFAHHLHSVGRYGTPNINDC